VGFLQPFTASPDLSVEISVPVAVRSVLCDISFGVDNGGNWKAGPQEELGVGGPVESFGNSMNVARMAGMP
jgi:hypothetical protein